MYSLRVNYFIVKVILDKNKAKIRTVVNKIESIHNDYRTMQLEVLAGNHSLVTTVIENGLKFNFDLALVYVFISQNFISFCSSTLLCFNVNTMQILEFKARNRKAKTSQWIHPQRCCLYVFNCNRKFKTGLIQ